jgi:hypothetical protein
MPYKKRTVRKVNWASFRHQVESLLFEEEFYNRRPNRSLPADEWLEWLIKRYKERNKEFIE